MTIHSLPAWTPENPGHPTSSIDPTEGSGEVTTRPEQEDGPLRVQYNGMVKRFAGLPMRSGNNDSRSKDESLEALVPCWKQRDLGSLSSSTRGRSPNLNTGT